MSWLFWMLMIMVVMFAIQGYRKGLIKTIVSMVFFIIVAVAASWISPYVGDFIREKTSWQEGIEAGCREVLFEEMGELSVSSQVAFIESLPLPETMIDKLVENNNAEMYREMAVETFSDYLSGYIAYGIINGIAFVAAFVLATIIVKMILYAVDILTDLPVIGTLNRLGGVLLGAGQGILWIWILFLMVTLMCNTEVGGYLMRLIKGDPALRWVYDHNYLMWVVMRVLV